MTTPITLETADSIVDDMLKKSSAVVIQRYKAMHRLRSDSAVSANMVLNHWQTESRLSCQLRRSDPITRRQQFSDAYDQFYKTLYWLNAWKDEASNDNTAIAYGYLTRLIGEVRDVYEVGSGKGELISFLASKGYHCTATEISDERGKKWDAGGTPNVTWKSSDGVHLANYEADSSYDVLISNQVIEHIHPADLRTHFTHAARILRKGGRYIVSTPHKFSGPADISSVFDFSEPMGFHLREYTNTELMSIVRGVGFSRIEAIYVTPQKMRRLVSISFSGRVYLKILLVMEACLARLPQKLRKRLFRGLLNTTLFRRDVYLCLIK